MKNDKNIKKNKSERGIALVEVIAALGVTVIVITALVSLSISTLRTSLNSKLLLEGSELSNREVELVRAYRDGQTTWQDFVDAVINCGPANPCSMSSSVDIVSNPSTEGSGSETVVRSFTATKPDGTALESTDQIVRVSVSVTWNIGGQQKGTYIYTDLTNWREE